MYHDLKSPMLFVMNNIEPTVVPFGSSTDYQSTDDVPIGSKHIYIYININKFIKLKFNPNIQNFPKLLQVSIKDKFFILLIN